ncbi:hypothetical protein EVAR_5444_1 [Eumeta japonica]|uniref:Uncharacterized protein n=1 Tax=Eumeta variegata TaxID=151549 RepID=A0A4C1T8V8_EUMVA|nr:hypothetical protein EVAR_5444_1 [Eumeta japonica]
MRPRALAHIGTPSFATDVAAVHCQHRVANRCRPASAAAPINILAKSYNNRSLRSRVELIKAEFDRSLRAVSVRSGVGVGALPAKRCLGDLLLLASSKLAGIEYMAGK